VFDISDSIIDTYVFVDDLQFGCEDLDAPTTAPTQ
jgi:hypothetical protein